MIEKLISDAKLFVRGRFANTTWKGAAAILCEDGEIVISTAPETVNESVSLCHETGGICEAYKKGKRVTLSVCISFDEKGKCHILSPCGVCQERLWFWGGGVEVAIPLGNDSTKAQTITLDKLSPHYWRRPFMERLPEPNPVNLDPNK